MKSRLVATYAVGFAVALSMMSSQTAAAQSTGSGRDSTARRTTKPKATSTQRIPVVKESPGEVIPVDTVVPPPPPPPAPVVEQPAPPPPPPPAPVAEVIPPPFVPVVRKPFPLYMMLGAGATLARGNAQTASWNEDLCIPGGPGDPISTAHKTGFGSMIGLGYDAPHSPLGIRFDVAYAKFTSTVVNTPEPQFQFHSEPELYSGNLDLKLRAPWINPFHNRFDIYAVGGGTYNRFHVTDIKNGPLNTAQYSNWTNQWGYNVGGGIEAGWRAVSLFAETRWFKFQNQPSVDHVPVILGLRFF